jgi:hypothetical protein
MADQIQWRRLSKSFVGTSPFIPGPEQYSSHSQQAKVHDGAAAGLCEMLSWLFWTRWALVMKELGDEQSGMCTEDTDWKMGGL